MTARDPIAPRFRHVAAIGILSGSGGGAVGSGVVQLFEGRTMTGLVTLAIGVVLLAILVGWLALRAAR